MLFQKGISIIIPNYNGAKLLPQTLPSVFAATKTISLPFEIIIVDDSSTDDSVALLRERFPQVKLVQNKMNSGFSVTINKGVEESMYALVLLLNSDVKLEPDYFQFLLFYFNKEDTFGVMGRIIGWDDEVIQDGAKYPYFHGVKIKTSGNYLLIDEKEMNKGLFSMYLSGANALIDKKKFVECGMLNIMFSPFYVEDYELSLRAWRLGWKCYYEHRAVCRHKTSTTIKSKNTKRFVDVIYNRNKMFLHAIHLDGGTKILWYAQLIAEAIMRLLFFQWTFIRSVCHFFGRQREVKEWRKKLFRIAGGKQKLLSVKEVASLITGSINNKNIRRF